MATNVRIRRLDPARSINESATSATTSDLRSIAWPEPAASARLTSRIDAARSRRELCSAGASPQMMLVTARIPSVKSRTGSIQSDLRLVRNRAGRHDGEDRGQTGVRERRAERAGDEREQQALGQQLTDQAAAAGAECDANAHLASAALPPSTAAGSRRSRRR